MIEIKIEGFQPAVSWRTGFDPVGAHFDPRTHLPKGVSEGHITLNTVPPDTFHPYRTTADGTGGEEIGGRRCIAFNVDHARTAIALATGDSEAPPALSLDDDTEARHQFESDLNVRLGDQLGAHLDNRCLATEW